MSSATITRAFSEGIEAAIPQAELSISQWAAAYRYIAPERSARPGRWRNEVVPFAVEIMDTVRQPGVRETVYVKSAQVAGSECINNVIGYFSHVEPCPLMYLAEEEGKARAWSTESFRPMVRDTPVLAQLYGDPKSRDGGNTIEGMNFPGGHLAIAWSTSPATLSSRPRRGVLMDERDAFRASKEGDPAELAEARTKTFDDGFILKVSTPRDRLPNPPGSPPDAPRYSPIEWEYENSDKRKYRVACPHCGEYQVLKWRDEQGYRVQWADDEKSEAIYVCDFGCMIEHEHKAAMLASGRWVAEKPFQGRAGFWINELYSPFTTWTDMLRAFEGAKHNPQKLRVFVNTRLAEGWEDNAEQAEVDDLKARREEFDAELLPGGVLVLTAAVDVQGDRLEAEKVGWGLDEESWSVDYKVFVGDPSQQAVWDELEEWLTAEHPYEVQVTLDDGRTVTVRQHLRVRCACIDSGGHHTEEVYRFTRKHAGRKFYAIKGANTPGKSLISEPTMQGKPKVRLYTIGTDTAKDTLAGYLLITEPGPGYCHFPQEFERDGRRYYDEKYFEQLRSERPVTVYLKRGTARVWQKLKPSARNEALDVRVYNMAARAILNPEWRALQRRRRVSAEKLARAAKPEPPESEADELSAVTPVEVEGVQEPAPDEPEPERPARRRKGRRRGGGWVNNW
jgi:phage terminase large subunit GpA-like protein